MPKAVSSTLDFVIDIFCQCCVTVVGLSTVAGQWQVATVNDRILHIKQSFLKISTRIPAYFVTFW